MTTNKEKILQIAKEKGVIKTQSFVADLSFSRQYISNLLSQLVDEGKLIKIGSTRDARYITHEYLKSHPDILLNKYSKILNNDNLEEHKVLDSIENDFIPYNKLSENIKSIFAYAFSEMLNNAIEHSKSKKINILVNIEKQKLSFIVDDFGIGIFRNIMQKRNLKNELEAIQDLLKGKTTTAPKLHSGEGIFFTSKIAEAFILDSHGWRLIVDNKVDDVFLRKVQGIKQGTRVAFSIDLNAKSHLNDIFRKYTNTSKNSDYGFDKTEIIIKLYTIGGVHISRSQARRVLSGLNKFNIIIMDYKDVPMVGQAFADEIYRVFKNKYPDIKIINENMNEAVQFMIKRSINEANK